MNFSLGERAEQLTGKRRALLERLLANRASAATPDDGRPPVPMRPPDPARVILLHPAGGELFCYTPLVRALSEGIGVAGFAADPRDFAVPDRDRMAASATRIVETLAKTGLPWSCCLVGWSYGGVLAFEIARQLERDTGQQPPVLLLDTGYYGDVVPDDEPTLRRRFVHDVARLAGHEGPAVDTVLSTGVVDIRQTLASLGVQIDLNDEELANRYAVFRACALALQLYSPPGPYGGPVTLLAAEARAAVEKRWRAVCTGRFQSDDLPGDHYTMFTEPALSRIVAEIERALAP